MENITAIIASLLMTCIGLLAIFKPLTIGKIIGLIPKGKGGISEIRTVYGGWIVGLAVYALWSNSSAIYHCLALGWFIGAFIRTVSFFIDKSFSPKNLRMAIYELLFSIAFFLT